MTVLIEAMGTDRALMQVGRKPRSRTDPEGGGGRSAGGRGTNPRPEKKSSSEDTAENSKADPSTEDGQ